MGCDFGSKTSLSLFDSVSVYPTTPNSTHRYNKTERLLPQHRTLKAGHPCSQSGFYSTTPPVPVGWTIHIQAEGQTYFNEPGKHFVTETDIRVREKYTRVYKFVRCIESKAEELNIPITNSMEVLLQPDPNDENSCGYYIIDHDARSIFWLDDFSSEQMDVPITPVSETHLQWALKEFYATHLEYFSAHLPGIDMSWIQELKGILAQARADHLTSTVGTFPYGADLCKEFSKLLRDHASSSTELLTDSYIIWIAARLWSQVARNRYLNYYGEGNARLSRDQYITECVPTDGPFILTALSKLALFDVPRDYAKELNLLWVDRVVYVGPWRAFYTKTLSEWRSFAIWLMALTMVHIFFNFTIYLPRWVPLASLTLTIAGLAISILLVCIHSSSTTLEPDDAVNYLEYFYHPTHGFALLGCAFSLPKVILYWSMILAIGEGAFCTTSVLDISPFWVMGGLGSTIVLGSVSVAVFYLRKIVCDSIASRDDVPKSKTDVEGKV